MFKSVPLVDYDSVKAAVPFDAWVATAKGLPYKHGKIVFSNGATLYYLHNHPLMLMPHFAVQDMAAIFDLDVASVDLVLAYPGNLVSWYSELCRTSPSPDVKDVADGRR